MIWIQSALSLLAAGLALWATVRARRTVAAAFAGMKESEAERSVAEATSRVASGLIDLHHKAQLVFEQDSVKHDIHARRRAVQHRIEHDLRVSSLPIPPNLQELIRARVLP